MPAIWDLFGTDGIAQRLLVLAKMIERATSRRLHAEFDISVAQWRVLAFVCMSGPATASFIGEAGEVDQAEISRAVKALIEQGALTREYAPGSRKAMVIAPTEKGEALYGRIRERRRSYFSSVTQQLRGDERAAFSRALSLIAEDVIAHRSQA